MTIQALITGILLLNSAAECQSPFDRALTSLLQTDANTFWLNLVQSRPEAVSPAFKLGVLGTLPTKGEILSLKAPARRRLAAAQEILRMHQRDLVYDVKVIDVPDAFVGLYARSVLLISLPALNLLSAEELQASVAHEVGHEYVWAEFEAARERKDFKRMQELEMFCDAVSVITLRRAGLDPSRMIDCFEKLLRYTHENFGPHPNEARYVSPGERKRFIQTVMSWAASSDSAPAR